MISPHNERVAPAFLKRAMSANVGPPWIFAPRADARGVSGAGVGDWGTKRQTNDQGGRGGSCSPTPCSSAQAGSGCQMWGLLRTVTQCAMNTIELAQAPVPFNSGVSSQWRPWGGYNFSPGWRIRPVEDPNRITNIALPPPGR